MKLLYINGKEISKYDASQIQRRMERRIRQDKKDLAGLQGILTSNTTDNKLIENTKTDLARKSLNYNTHKNELEDFIKQTSFKKDNSRLFIAGYSQSITTEIGKVTKIANKYNKSDIIGMKVNNIEITEIGEHIISRTYARGLSFEDVEYTLKNSKNYGTIKTDKDGRKSFCVYGKKITVSVNPDTGKVITARQTNRREKKRYGFEE